MRLVTPAIVLRTVDYGEADRVVTLFTRDAGKLSALARGARKSVKRFGAALGLFGVGEAVLVDKPNVELSALERFDGARGFPANVNVAAALALAGIGPDRTMMEIWADPSVERNCHSVEVESDSACFTLSIENIPSENPRTGRITALSVLAALRKLKAPLRVGT